MPGAPQKKASAGGVSSCGAGEGGVPRGGQDVEQNAVGKDTVADIGEDVMITPKQFLREMRRLQEVELNMAKQGKRLPFGSVRGKHGLHAISFEFILSLLTNDNYPPDQMFSFVLENCLSAEDYHVNSIILSFPQIHAKHAIISISVSTAQWYICSGPDTHPLTVNNVSVGQDQVPLHDGDIIVIGNVELNFTCVVK